jgi:hypothetical protein
MTPVAWARVVIYVDDISHWLNDQGFTKRSGYFTPFAARKRRSRDKVVPSPN